MKSKKPPPHSCASSNIDPPYCTGNSQIRWQNSTSSSFKIRSTTFLKVLYNANYWYLYICIWLWLRNNRIRCWNSTLFKIVRIR
jgi:hypothetical protein